MKHTSLGYPIIIEAGLFAHISHYIQPQNYSKIAVITDIHVAERYMEQIKHQLGENILEIIVPAGEEAKTITTVEHIWKVLLDNRFDRKSLVINLGGGVIGDMGGFTASTYMRGVSFIQVPTTLLSMVDASIGGKTGINVNGIKNSIGSFATPSAVLIDVETLKTLPSREFCSGFAEIIKHGLIADKTYFDLVTAKEPFAFSNTELVDIITRSCQIKSDIVLADPKETGIRALLNFGHTIGHAVEASTLETHHPLHHGEAISLGMVAEAKLSQIKGYISLQDVKLIETVLRQAELPIRSITLDVQECMQKITMDKKNEFGEIRFTLLSAIGKGTIHETATTAEIVSCVEYITS